MMTVPLEWIYLAITVPFVVVWCVLWLSAPHVRRELIRTSVAFAVIGVVVENLFYYQDYWSPQSIFPIDVAGFLLFPEALLFGGVFGGIAAVVYRVVFRMREEFRDTNGSRSRFFVSGGIFLSISYALFFLGVNSIYAHACASLALAAFIAFRRDDLRAMVFGSGVLTLVIMFSCYSLVWALVSNMEQLLAAVWLLYDTPLDVRFLGIPLTELLWGFSAGSAIGVIRAYVKGIRYTAPTL